MDSDKLLRLLIVENSRNDAQRYIRTLRMARFAVRASVAEDDEDIEDLLAKQEFDLLLTIASPEGVTLQEVFGIVDGLAPNLPVVVACDDFNTDTVLAAMRLGARGVIDRDSEEHLQRIIDRELESVQARRERDQLRQSMQELERRALALLSSSRDAIAYVHDGMHIFANNSYLEIFGFQSMDEVESTPILDIIAPEDRPGFRELTHGINHGDHDEQEFELKGLRPDGTTFPARLELSPASYDQERCTQVIIRDQSDNLELERKLSDLTSHDALTGLYNRQHYLDHLQKLINADDTEETAVVHVVIDRYREAKESVGIAAADRMIAGVADLLKQHFTAEDTISRFGDHSFALLSRGRGDDTLMAAAEAFRKALQEQLFEIGDRALSVTCSIGINPADHAESAQEAVSMADLACDSVVRGGGNGVKLHDAIGHARQHQERDRLLVETIHAAGKGGRFKLYYQPIVSLRGDNSENYEVLLRMVDDRGDEVPPGQFIPAAERSGQISSIERWVIANTIHVAKRRASTKHTNFFVNLSAVSLTDAKLIGWLRQQITDSKLPPEHLVFEIGEEAITSHFKGAKAFTKALRDIGCRVSIDHFGALPSSMATLREIDADYLKLDRSLMSVFLKDEKARATVREITDIGHESKKMVIAEFVEDASMLSSLWQSDVDYIQGYFLQEPSPSMTFDFEGESL